jgi:hypothetical protein
LLIISLKRFYGLSAKSFLKNCPFGFFGDSEKTGWSTLRTAENSWKRHIFSQTLLASQVLAADGRFEGDVGLLISIDPDETSSSVNAYTIAEFGT